MAAAVLVNTESPLGPSDWYWEDAGADRLAPWVSIVPEAERHTLAAWGSDPEGEPALLACLGRAIVAVGPEVRAWRLHVLNTAGASPIQALAAQDALRRGNAAYTEVEGIGVGVEPALPERLGEEWRRAWRYASLRAEQVYITAPARMEAGDVPTAADLAGLARRPWTHGYSPMSAAGVRRMVERRVSVISRFVDQRDALLLVSVIGPRGAWKLWPGATSVGAEDLWNGRIPS